MDNRMGLITAVSAVTTWVLVATLPVSAQSTDQTETTTTEEGECIELDRFGPGLYATVHRDRIFVEKEGRRLDLGEAESAFANSDELSCLERAPDFLNWPCLGLEDEELLFEEYDLDSLPEEDVVAEVVKRFFEDNAIIYPSPDWRTGAYHRDVPLAELDNFLAPGHWYRVARERTVLDRNVPETVLISLYRDEEQVVVDQEMLVALRDERGMSEFVPVFFLFNEPKVVPVSRFGAEATLRVIADAFFEEDTRVTEVPSIFDGDYHLLVTVKELEDLFEIPTEDEIGDERMQELIADLQANGFSRKALIVAMFHDVGNMALDETEKVRAAITMGMTELPVVVLYYLPDSHLDTCRRDDIQFGNLPLQRDQSTLTQPPPPTIDASPN